MSLEAFVTSQRRIQKLREESKVARKQLLEEANDARSTLVELMLAAGVDSVKAGDHEYLVLVEKAKPVQPTTEMLQTVLSNLTEQDLRAAVSDGGPVRAGGAGGGASDLVTSVKTLTRSRLAKGTNGDEEDEDDVVYSLKTQCHVPRNFRRPPSGAAETIEVAVRSFTAADLAKRVYNGQLKDLLDEARSPVDEAAEMAAFDYAQQGGGEYHAITLPPVEGLETPDEPVYIKAEKKERQKKPSKKRFLEIVDATVDDFLKRRFGEHSSVDASRLREIAQNSSEITDAVEQQLDAAPTEVSRTVSLTSKKPRQRRGN
tara:strand:+ start:4210 stop:5157 length:948 start_codon:yes stop_codon:yes gene_type:complete